jgi:hypothetical protein
VHVSQDVPAKRGRWVSAFARDVEPGDTIRREGKERYVVGRDRPPVTQPMFRLEYGTEGESIAKVAPVQIWDPDGSVADRVERLYAEARALAAGSGSNGILGGFVEPK